MHGFAYLWLTWWLGAWCVVALAGGLVIGPWLRRRRYEPGHAGGAAPIALEQFYDTVPVAQVKGTPPWELLPAPTLAEARWVTRSSGPDWREQTTAELSPEALEIAHTDPGPGEVPSDAAPGPDSSQVDTHSELSTPGPTAQRESECSATWLEAQMDELWAWVREMNQQRLEEAMA